MDITRLGKDASGRYQAPIAWCAVVCESCGALGPQEIADGDHDHFARGMAVAGALSKGFVERLDGRLLRTFCARCAVPPASPPPPAKGQLPLFGIDT